ncbi:MAG: hypothetical protein ACI9MB_004039, partial [Verrucomicrobiales bacterium]
MESEKLSFACPACQGVLRIPIELAGVHGPCPNCRTEIAAPIPASQTLARLLHPEPAPVAAIPPFPNSTIPATEPPVQTTPAYSPQQPQPQAQSATHAEPAHLPQAPRPPSGSPGSHSLLPLPQAQPAPEAQAWPPLNPAVPTPPLPIPEAPTSPPLSTPSGLPWQETPTQPQAQQGALTLPENSLAAAIPFPRHAEEEQEISPWESPPSFIDEPPPHPEGPIPAPDQPSHSEAPEQTPTQSTAVSSPLPFENEAGKKGRKRKTKKLKSSQGQKSTSPRRLPIILKITIPLLLLAGIGVGYVKFWPETQAKLGMGPPLKTSSPETPPGMPTSLKTEDDPSGFKYIDEANSKTEAVTPSPEARFEADPIP